MSQQVSDVEVRLLLDKLNRRTKLFSSLARSPWYYAWFHALSIIGVAALLLLAGDPDDSNPILLSFAAGILTIPPLVCFTLVNSRINTLIELLRQEGILESALPTSREAKPQDDSPHTRNENRTS